MDRFAVYYAPRAKSLLHELGSAWLGRDALIGERVPQPDIPDIERLTTEPRRYGFHATLKAPFRLADGVSPARLPQDLSALAAELSPVTLPPLGLYPLGGTLVLVPQLKCAAVDQCAARCVEALDGLRRPSTPEELARRQAMGLAPRQEFYLLRWGYPYVFDEFRFHLTLTNALTPREAERILPEARRHFAPVLDRELTVDSLSLFRQPWPEAPFVLQQRFPLTGSAEAVWWEVA